MSAIASSALEVNLFEDLLECLSHLEPSDSTKAFAVFDREKNPPNPGIYLNKSGSIGLPLSDGDAKVLRAASHTSLVEKDPAESGGETVWVVPAGEFEIHNPAWAPFLQGIIAKVSAGLGVNSTGKGISAELFSLSLYDEGPSSATSQE
jgi:hypothetical protein